LDALNPKFELFRKNVNEMFNVNFSLPQNVETKHLLMAAIVLEGVGGLLFILGSSLGAYLLVSNMHTKTFLQQSFLVSVFTPQFVHTTSHVWIAFDKWDALQRNLLEQH
jgi:hypothetical protein